MGTLVTYAFVNAQTGNKVGFLSVAEEMDESILLRKLNHERARLAVRNAIYIETIFWEKNQRHSLIK